MNFPKPPVRIPPSLTPPAPSCCVWQEELPGSCRRALNCASLTCTRGSRLLRVAPWAQLSEMPFCGTWTEVVVTFWCGVKGISQSPQVQPPLGIGHCALCIHAFHFVEADTTTKPSCAVQLFAPENPLGRPDPVGTPCFSLSGYCLHFLAAALALAYKAIQGKH